MRETKTNALVVALRELKMFGMAQAAGELAEQGAPAFEAAQPLLGAQLLKAETAEREVRAVAYQLKQARFPVYRDLAGFEFEHGCGGRREIGKARDRPPAQHQPSCLGCNSIQRVAFMAEWP